MPAPSKRVFVSYSHKDSKWVDELNTFMAPWLRDKRVSLWSDKQIGVGQDWRAQIQNEISQARVAVLLVTKDFLASDFIAKHELSRLLERARAKQLTLVWVAVGHCAYAATELAEFQAANDPARPLDSLRGPQRDKVLTSIARKIADAATMSTLAGGFQIVDETSEPMEAVVEHRAEQSNRVFGVQAHYEPAQTQIAFSGATTVITADDLALLPEQDREFIADLEDSLDRNYKRWSAIRKGLGNAGGALDEEIGSELARVGKLICGDLADILDFLRKMHKYELEDHYLRYRYICEKLSAV
jgi:hypothetical protein